MAFPIPLRPPRSTFYFSPAAVHPALQSHSHLFVELGGAKSPTHSAAPINLPPPPASFAAFSKRRLSSPRPARLDERTHDRLNKHTGTQWSLCLQRPPASVSSYRAHAHTASASARPVCRCCLSPRGAGCRPAQGAHVCVAK